MDNEDKAIESQANTLFGDLDEGVNERRPTFAHMPSSSQFKRQPNPNFSQSRPTSMQSWFDRPPLAAGNGEDNGEVDETISDEQDAANLWAARQRPHRVSTQSGCSQTSASSKGSHKSNVWRRDSLFSFGPKQALRDVIEEQTDGDAAMAGDVRVPPNKRVGFVAFTMRFLLDTAGHGIPRIVEKDISLFRRIVWACIVLAAAVTFTVQTRTLVTRYLDRDFKVDVKYNFNKEIGFPAVTFCNLNPLNRSKLECSRFDTERDDPVHDCNGRRNGTRSMQSLIQGLLLSYQQALYSFSYRFNFTQEPLTEAEYAKYGFDLSEILVSCMYRGQECSAKNFTKFQNRHYGTCFTFNGNETTQLQTSQPGPAFGLTMDFFFNDLVEIGLLTPSTGIRVSLHEPRAHPFPEEDGISIAPGSATSLGVRQSVVERLSEPYGNCTTIDGYDWAKVFAGYKYTRATCLKECVATTMLRECGCVSSEFLVGERLCVPHYINSTEAACRDRIELAYRVDKLTCGHCFSPCVESLYQVTLSTATWPSTEYQREFKKLLTKRNFTVDNVAADLFRDQYARVNIFYEELNYENIVQKPAYEPENLLADVGGQFGLWLGFSVLAILELVEYLIYILLVALGKVQLPVEEEDATDNDEKVHDDVFVKVAL